MKSVFVFLVVCLPFVLGQVSLVPNIVIDGVADVCEWPPAAEIFTGPSMIAGVSPGQTITNIFFENLDNANPPAANMFLDPAAPQLLFRADFAAPIEVGPAFSMTICVNNMGGSVNNPTRSTNAFSSCTSDATGVAGPMDLSYYVTFIPSTGTGRVVPCYFDGLGGTPLCSAPENLIDTFAGGNPVLLDSINNNVNCAIVGGGLILECTWSQHEDDSGNVPAIGDTLEIYIDFSTSGGGVDFSSGMISYTVAANGPELFLKGDPHLQGEDGAVLNFDGQPGRSYMLLADQEHTLDARLKAYGEHSVIEATSFRYEDLQVEWDLASGAPTLNGEPIVSVAKRDGGNVAMAVRSNVQFALLEGEDWWQKSLILETPCYTVEISQRLIGHSQLHLDVEIRDFHAETATPQGLLGQTAHAGSVDGDDFDADDWQVSALGESDCAHCDQETLPKCLTRASGGVLPERLPHAGSVSKRTRNDVMHLRA